MLEIPRDIPIRIEDVELIKNLLLQSIRENVQPRADDPDSESFNCAFAIDWQSEDKKTVRRITRYDLSCLNGQFIEIGEVPTQYKADRDIISQTFELRNALAIGFVSRNDKYVQIDLTPHGIPDGYFFNREVIALWENCGALILSIMSEWEDANERIVVLDIPDGLKASPEFRDCRQWQEEWQKQNDGGWQTQS